MRKRDPFARDDSSSVFFHVGFGFEFH